MKRCVSVLTVLILCSGSLFAQKIKYKDLFVLLDSRQYDDAEPFLRKYLKENDDNPSAHLFMAFILQEKCQKADVLKQADQVASNADSATLFFDLAKKEITEKEIKRNDEYYQQYSRRDQRTGEFGIKMSDIHLDIEKRVQELKVRKQRVAVLRSQFVSWERLYQASAAGFKAIQEAYPGEREFLLQSDDKTIEALTAVLTNYDSATLMFQAYKNTLALIAKAGYNQNVTARKISNFKEDGQGLPDFYSDEVKGWDYGGWSKNALKEIQTEVEPFREKLVSYDVEINKLFDKIRKDSSSVTGLISAVESKVKVNPVARFDAAPMPLILFRMKIEELKFTSSYIDNKKKRDTTDLLIRLDAVKGELKILNRLDSVAGILVAKDIEKETANYQHFVTNAYGSTKMLTSLISATKEFSEHEKHRREDVVTSLNSSLNWLRVDKDSVAVGTAKQRRPNHYPLALNPEKWASGVKYGADSVASGFFYTITPTRIPDVKASFTVDKVNFARKNLPIVKCLAAGNEAGTVYYSVLFSETKVADKFAVTIARINKPEGLVWTSNYKFDFLPSELIVSPETGELSVKITAPGGESKLVMFDKNGKQL